MLKKIISIMLIMTMLTSLSAVGFANGEHNVTTTEPLVGTRMMYVTYTDCDLDINSSGLAQMYASIDAVPGVDSVRISMYLQRYSGSWSTVKHWAQDYTGTDGSMSKSYSVTKGYQYRILVYFYAYDGSESESTSKTNEDWY